MTDSPDPNAIADEDVSMLDADDIDIALEHHGFRLTPRQLEITKLLAMGRSNSEIADALDISIKTVDSHRTAIMKRLGTRNNVELARLAIKIGLVAAP